MIRWLILCCDLCQILFNYAFSDCLSTQSLILRIPLPWNCSFPTLVHKFTGYYSWNFVPILLFQYINNPSRDILLWTTTFCSYSQLTVYRYTLEITPSLLCFMMYMNVFELPYFQQFGSFKRFQTSHLISFSNIKRIYVHQCLVSKAHFYSNHNVYKLLSLYFFSEERVLEIYKTLKGLSRGKAIVK